MSLLGIHVHARLHMQTPHYPAAAPLRLQPGSFLRRLRTVSWSFRYILLSRGAVTVAFQRLWYEVLTSSNAWLCTNFGRQSCTRKDEAVVKACIILCPATVNPRIVLRQSLASSIPGHAGCSMRLLALDSNAFWNYPDSVCH